MSLTKPLWPPWTVAVSPVRANGWLVRPWITCLAAYVNGVCLGDVEQLHSSGFSLAKQPAPVNTLPRPVGVSYRSNSFSHLFQVRWARVPGAVVYQVEICEGEVTDTANWQRVALTTRPSTQLEWRRGAPAPFIRVCAIGTQLQGPYSEVSSPMAA
jgi:hypothetical protein